MDKKIYDKIYACWLGKSIGGTLGTPVEGHKEFMNLTFYPRLGSEGALPNDDLDLQLVNLHALEQHGILTDADAIADEWSEHVRFPWDEYGYSSTAMRYGLKPPYSGCYDNPFTNCMGSPIRSEIWAVIAFGDPRLAAYFAWQDAVVDHAGGEGVYGEMFYAALETLALFSDDKEALVEKALSCIPEVSRVYKAVADTLRWYRQGVGYPEIRDLILESHGNPNFTDAPQNLAFSIVGLLYGADFEDGMLKTVNLGYDTDCTVATLGSIYGLLYGTSFIPEKWSAPIGTKIVVSDAVIGCDPPADIGELTDRSVRLIESLAPIDKSAYTVTADQALDILRQTYTLPNGDPKKNLSVTLRYDDGGVDCLPDSKKRVTLNLSNNSGGDWDVIFTLTGITGTCTPDRLRVSAGSSADVTLTLDIPHDMPRLMRPELQITRLHDHNPWKTHTLPFTLLRSSKWKICGEETYISGTRLYFNKKRSDNTYTAETTFTLPTARRCKLMTASTSPISAILDGSPVIDDPNSEDFMPAYHRCPHAQSYTADLEEGVHSIKVTLTSADLPDFIFAVLAPNAVSEPGNHYAYIDAEIG